MKNIVRRSLEIISVSKLINANIRFLVVIERAKGFDLSLVHAGVWFCEWKFQSKLVQGVVTLFFHRQIIIIALNLCDLYFLISWMFNFNRISFSLYFFLNSHRHDRKLTSLWIYRVLNNCASRWRKRNNFDVVAVSWYHYLDLYFSYCRS